jgi:hypothetical protein
MKGMPHPSRALRGRVGILTLFHRVTHGSLAKSLQSAECDRRGKIIGPVSDGKPDTNSSPYQKCAIARNLVRVTSGGDHLPNKSVISFTFGSAAWLM